MDPQFIKPRTLGLFATRQCPAACDHCGTGSSPRVTERIPPKRLTDLIDEATEIPSIDEVSFTGGECFLLGKEFVDRIRQATGLGYYVGAVSNAYWAVNKRAAVRTIDSVTNAGLKALMLSTGEMHAKFIPPERVIDAATVAHDAGIDVDITIEDFGNTTFDWRLIYDHPEVARRRKRSGFRVVMNRWMPHAEGEGKATLRHAPRLDRFKHKKPSRCEQVMDLLMVTSALKLVSCCGLPLYYLPDLWLGSVADKTLAQALAEAPFDPLKLWLHVMGPERMLLFVKKYIPDYDLPSSSHICQTCLHLYRDSRAVDVLREHYAEVQVEIEKTYLQYRARALAQG